MPGIEIRVDPQNHEIMYKGRNTMMGYLKLPQDTLRTLDAEGWIHTGDQGQKDADGFLKVTGRIKELIVTAGGENISPIIIENKVMELASIFSSCIAIGDKRKFISLLICIRCELNPDGESTHRLAPDVKRFLAGLGSTAVTIEEAMTDEKVKAYIDGIVEKYNKVAVSRAQEIRKWCILPEEFTIGRGELTATMKLRRTVVQEHYAKEIDAMYQFRVCYRAQSNKQTRTANLLTALLNRLLGGALHDEEDDEEDNHDNNHNQENQAPHLEATPEATALGKSTRVSTGDHSQLLVIELGAHIARLANGRLHCLEHIKTRESAGDVIDVVGLSLLHSGSASEMEVAESHQIVALHRRALKKSVVRSIH